MLFPAVHQLGFQAGQAVSNFLYNTVRTTMEKNNIDAATVVRVLTDRELLLTHTVELVCFLMRLPGLYKAWWWNLVAKDPLHVAIETIMLMSIVYMMLSRSTEGYKDSSKDKLNKREQEELLWEWKHKTRKPLAPPRKNKAQASSSVGTEPIATATETATETATANATATATATETSYHGNGNGNDKGALGVDIDDDFQIVVQKQEGKWLTVTVPDHWITDPEKSKNKNTTATSTSTTTTTTAAAATTTKKKSAETIPQTSQNSSKTNKTKNNHRNGKSTKKTSSKRKTTTTTTTPIPRAETELRVLNFCNFDFLGFQTSEELRKASTDALNRYGCGSCGPRGFYGTIDVHLQLEEEIAGFCKTDQAILYSDGASTCTSTVSAFAKRGDLLVVDEGVYEPLSTGVFLSRANVHWFRHNDVKDLERVLKELQATDKKLGRKPSAQRRFIVVEGLYKNLGTIAPLDEIIALKHKYKYRLILDESFSFGTLGKTGRGSLEEHGKRPMYDAEITTIALENAMGSIGGVTVGTEEVVDHQRLSGAGYCFSASAPPFTSSAGVASLRLLQQRPQLVQNLQSNVKYTYQRLLEKVDEHNARNTKKDYNLVVTSDSRSPIVVLQLERESIYESAIMSGIMRECLQRGVGIVASTTDFGESAAGGAIPTSGTATTTTTTTTTTELAPCIRMTVSTLHTRDDTDAAIDALIESAALVTNRYPDSAATSLAT